MSSKAGVEGLGVHTGASLVGWPRALLPQCLAWAGTAQVLVTLKVAAHPAAYPHACPLEAEPGVGGTRGSLWACTEESQVGLRPPCGFTKSRPALEGTVWGREGQAPWPTGRLLECPTVSGEPPGLTARARLSTTERSRLRNEGREGQAWLGR